MTLCADYVASSEIVDLILINEVRTRMGRDGLIMGGCHSVHMKMLEMTNDVDESVTAHNGGNDHDQCHHHHDTHPALK